MARGKPFQKGQSGNPGGRPAIAKEVREKAQEHGTEAIEGILAIARDEQNDGRTRVAAWCAILDRGYGKPSQDFKFEGEVTTQIKRVILVKRETPGSVAGEKSV